MAHIIKRIIISVFQNLLYFRREIEKKSNIFIICMTNFSEYTPFVFSAIVMKSRRVIGWCDAKLLWMFLLI